jgi:hypothetical protein
VCVYVICICSCRSLQENLGLPAENNASPVCMMSDIFQVEFLTTGGRGREVFFRDVDSHTGPLFSAPV